MYVDWFCGIDFDIKMVYNLFGKKREKNTNNNYKILRPFTPTDYYYKSPYTYLRFETGE